MLFNPPGRFFAVTPTPPAIPTDYLQTVPLLATTAIPGPANGSRSWMGLRWSIHEPCTQSLNECLPTEMPWAHRPDPLHTIHLTSCEACQDYEANAASMAMLLLLPGPCCCCSWPLLSHRSAAARNGIAAPPCCCSWSLLPRSAAASHGIASPLWERLHAAPAVTYINLWLLLLVEVQCECSSCSCFRCCC